MVDKQRAFHELATIVAGENAFASKIKIYGLKAFAVYDALFRWIIRIHFFNFGRSGYSIARPKVLQPGIIPIHLQAQLKAAIESGMLIAAARAARGCVGWVVGYSASPTRKTRTGGPTKRGGEGVVRGRLMATARTAECHDSRKEPLTSRRHRPGMALRACDKRIRLGHGRNSYQNPCR
jgi:hypothetical protein